MSQNEDVYLLPSSGESKPKRKMQSFEVDQNELFLPCILASSGWDEE